MAIVGATNQASGIVHYANGSFTGDGTITEVVLGFVPSRVELVNVTDRIQHIWQQGMEATNTLNIAAAGTGTLDTNSHIVPKGTVKTDTFDGFQVAAAAAVSAKLYVWSAWG